MTKTYSIRFLAVLAVSALLIAPAIARADATLFLSSTSAAVGGSGKICVSMKGGASEIAGLQANMHWDDRCMTPDNARSLCKANSATGKSVQSALQGRGTLKAILISFSDVNPIPDGELFCCTFLAVGEPGTRCAGITIDGIIGSTGQGARISNITASAAPGVFAILGTGGESGSAVTGGAGPDTGAGQAPAPVAEFAPPGAVVGESGGAAPGGAAPGGPVGAAPAGRAGAPAPGIPAQPPPVPENAPPPQYGENVREPGVQPEVPAQGVEQPEKVENLGAAGGPTTIIGTPTPVAPTATQAVPPTPTKKPDTPTPIPPTNSPTPKSGWMGGCEMRIPR